jgi:Zn-dependent protease
MKGSLSLGRIFGIKLYIHFTFLLIFLYIGYYSYRATNSFDQIPYDFAIILIAFVFVIMHEFGHALAARRVGIQTRQILILPIGGMAQLDNMPENPKDELFVTFCGPAVNLAAVIILLPIFLVTHSIYDLIPSMALNNDWIAAIIGINLTLFIFNLIPAFPMDGGRIFRALLAFKLSYLKATLIAARTGQAIAIGVFGYFMVQEFQGHMEFLSIIKLLLLCVFIVVLAGMEYRMVKQKYKMGYYDQSNDGFARNGSINISNSISDAINELSRNGKNQVPVMYHDKIAGIISNGIPDQLKDKGFKSNSNSHTWKYNPSDSLGHALKMMEILDIPLIPLYQAQMANSEYYLWREG